MKLYRYILISVALVSSLTGCNEDLLDVKPSDKFTETNVFTDENTLELYVNGCYSGFYTFGQIGWWFSLSTDLFVSPLSDENYAKHDFWETRPIIEHASLGGSNLGCLTNKWAESYSYIKNCNLYLNNLSYTVNLNQELVGRYTDEVRFIRSYLFFDLLSYWGGVPLVTEIPDLVNYEKNIIPRSTPEQVVNFIVSEMDQIIKNEVLPASFLTCDKSYQGRVTLTAAYALKAKALLYLASPLFNSGNDKTKWEAASVANKASVEFAEKCGHKLYPDYSVVTTAPFNEEIVFSRSFSSETTDGGRYRSWLDEQLNSPSNGGWTSLCPTQQQVEAYETADGKKITDPTSGYKLERFWENRDPRLYGSILYDGAPWKGKTIETFIPGGIDSSEAPVGSWNYSITGYFVRKFISESVAPADYDKRRGTIQHKIIFRLGGMYLDYAECLINIGDEDGARKYINDVRSRVKMPPISDAGEQLKERYINERRVELFMENHRWFDLRRWNIATEVLDNFIVKAIHVIKKGDGTKVYSIEDRNTYKYPKHYNLMPIPKDEIDKSRGVLIQNPVFGNSN